MNNYGTWAKILGVVAVGLLLYAFFVQNSLRTSELSLNLGFAAWELASPQPVPLLLGIAFLLGTLPVLLWAWWRNAALRREVERLQQEIALAGRKNTWGT